MFSVVWSFCPEVEVGFNALNYGWRISVVGKNVFDFNRVVPQGSIIVESKGPRWDNLGLYKNVSAFNGRDVFGGRASGVSGLVSGPSDTHSGSREAGCNNQKTQIADGYYPFPIWVWLPALWFAVFLTTFWFIEQG